MSRRVVDFEPCLACPSFARFVDPDLPCLHKRTDQRNCLDRINDSQHEDRHSLAELSSSLAIYTAQAFCGNSLVNGPTLVHRHLAGSLATLVIHLSGKTTAVRR